MPGAFIISYHYLKKSQKQEENIRRRLLRDDSDPMSVSDEMFVEFYRVNKHAFSMILDNIASSIRKGSIPAKIQLSATLRFLAVGAFQGVIANDSHISLGRSTFSKVLWVVMGAMEEKICPSWINLKLTEDEIKASKLHFYTKFGLPGVIGCVDGTHVRIIKPTENESIFYNRKGYFSLNVLVICDFEMKIRAVDACRPGSTHDSLIWRMSDARKYIKEKFENGEESGWLLGDSGYGLERCLLTPYRNAQYGTREHNYNKRHCSARNVVERTIGNLKSRFRCLQCTTLHYKPQKVVKIVNVCSALHNICKTYNIPIRNEFLESIESGEEIDYDSLNSDGHYPDSECLQIRNSIADSLTT